MEAGGGTGITHEMGTFSLFKLNEKKLAIIEYHVQLMILLFDCMT